MTTKKKIELTEKMRGKIEKFLKGWKGTDVNDMFNIHDYHDWMEGAVDLLKEVVGYEDEDEDED